jgi:hypothetical protein
MRLPVAGGRPVGRDEHRGVVQRPVRPLEDPRHDRRPCLGRDLAEQRDRRPLERLGELAPPDVDLAEVVAARDELRRDDERALGRMPTERVLETAPVEVERAWLGGELQRHEVDPLHQPTSRGIPQVAVCNLVGFPAPWRCHHASRPEGDSFAREAKREEARCALKKGARGGNMVSPTRASQRRATLIP